MNRSRLAWILAVIMLASGILLARIPLKEQQLFDEDTLERIRQACTITDAPKFEDRSLRIRFAIRGDYLVCDLNSPDQLAGIRLIYIWKKDLFRATESSEFFQGIEGEVRVSASLESPAQTGQKLTQLLNFPTVSVAPDATRTAEFNHYGNIYMIRERDEQVGLLDSFEFLAD